MTSPFTVEYAGDARALAEQFFGRNFADEELACAVGALDGAKVIVRKKKSADDLRIEIQHPLIEDQQRWIRRDQNGDLIIFNYRFYKKLFAPKGIGLNSFLRQVQNAPALGIRRIETFAAGNYHTLRSHGDSGYFVWARFGFDAPLLATQQALLKQFPPLAGVTTLNELFRRPGGAEWWKINGSDIYLVFDVSPQSSMMENLRNYLQEKGRNLL
jgi:hypothetical protein